MTYVRTGTARVTSPVSAVRGGQTASATNAATDKTPQGQIQKVKKLKNTQYQQRHIYITYGKSQING